MKITAIAAQKKERGRRNLLVDGEFAVALSVETLLRAGLRVGDTVTPETVERLRQEDLRREAKNTALRLLGRRPRTVKEIRDRLAKKGIDAAIAAGVLEELTAAGLLDDRTVARMVVRDMLTHRPSGGGAMRQKLARLGVPKETAAGAIGELAGSGAQREAALAAARKYMQRKPIPRRAEDRKKLRARLSSFLLRRGFSWDDARPAVAALFNEDETEGSP
jgi:regulatory protein